VLLIIGLFARFAALELEMQKAFCDSASLRLLIDAVKRFHSNEEIQTNSLDTLSLFAFARAEMVSDFLCTRLFSSKYYVLDCALKNLKRFAEVRIGGVQISRHISQLLKINLNHNFPIGIRVRAIELLIVFASTEDKVACITCSILKRKRLRQDEQPEPSWIDKLAQKMLMVDDNEEDLLLMLRSLQMIKQMVSYDSAKPIANEHAFKHSQYSFTSRYEQLSKTNENQHELAAQCIDLINSILKIFN